MTARQCERCGQPLDDATRVSLELNTYTGQYHRPGDVPADESQGVFDFGPDCAARVLANGGINVRQVMPRRRKRTALR